jgi:hypothetical protein
VIELLAGEACAVTALEIDRRLDPGAASPPSGLRRVRTPLALIFAITRVAGV